MKNSVILTIILLLFTQCILLNKAKPMTESQIDSLCIAMDSTIWNNAFKQSSNNDTTFYVKPITFIRYLDNVYINNRDSIQLLFTTTQTPQGTLLRIGKGGYSTQKKISPYLGRIFFEPQNISEQAYFFLNNTLIKYTHTTGRTDYNFEPSAYWINISVNDYYFNSDTLFSQHCYGSSDMFSPTTNRNNLRMNKIEGDNILKNNSHTIVATGYQWLATYMQLHKNNE